MSVRIVNRKGQELERLDQYNALVAIVGDGEATVTVEVIDSTPAKPKPAKKKKAKTTMAESSPEPPPEVS